MELEVIGFDLSSCALAQDGGADRIELCANPHEGGTTPSAGTIAAARAATTIELFPIIRPRGGDFLYSAAEFEAMLADVERCGELGCDGVVIGMLTAAGDVDVDRCADLVARAGAMQVTFHRAFDRVRDPLRALADVIDLGCARILTSGLHPTAEQGKDVLRRLVEVSAGRTTIMAGSGVRSDNVATLARYTGATAFHSSARTVRPSAMEYTNPVMAEDLSVVTIDPVEVAALRAKLSALR